MTSIITAKIHELMTETGHVVDQITNRNSSGSSASIKPLSSQNNIIDIKNELINSAKFSDIDLNTTGNKLIQSTDDSIDMQLKTATSSFEKTGFASADIQNNAANSESNQIESIEQFEVRSTAQLEEKSTDQSEVQSCELVEIKPPTKFEDKLMKFPEIKSNQAANSLTLLRSSDIEHCKTPSPPKISHICQGFNTIKPQEKTSTELINTKQFNTIDNNFLDKTFNPISETLNMKPNIRKFKLLNNENLTCYSPLIINSTTQDDSLKIEKIYYWISMDYELFFGNNNLSREIALTKSLRYEDDDQMQLNLNNEKIIYISTNILNPDKIFNIFFKNSINKLDLYIDLILNNNGCNILLQILKYFKLNQTKLINKINFIYIKFSTSYINQIKVIFNLIIENNIFYQKIKSLGLFIGLHHYGNGYVFGPIEDIKSIKLPNNLEKLVIANGLNLNDFNQFPITLKEISLHNVDNINFSKFNLNKNLKILCINGETRLIGRKDNYPKSFLEFKNLKLNSSYSICLNFSKFNQLTSLSLSNLSFIQTRELNFPKNIKKLELIDCMISSHISSFPDSLRFLYIMGGKWKIKKNCNLSKLLKLKIENIDDVQDLNDKISSCLNLLRLEVINSPIYITQRFRFPSSLKILKLINVKLKGIHKLAFPSLLEIVNLESNEINFLIKNSNLKILRMDSNCLEADINASELSVKDLILSNNPNLTSIELNSNTTYLNVSKTKINSIIGDNLSKLILDECKETDWNQFKFPRQIIQLSIQNSEITKFEIFEKLLKLKNLNLSNNKITRMNLNNFENLQNIDLSFNSLEELKIEDFPCSIKSIKCDSNFINKIDLEKLENLEWLQLQNNQLKSVADLNNLPTNLKNLNLSSNEFQEILNTEFQIPKNLQFLTLNQCKIHKFDKILIPNSLISLNLSNNKLNFKTFEIEFYHQGKSSLKFIDLSNNFFNKFNFNILNNKLKKIEINEINLANNMFEDIPNIPDNILSAILFKT
ncbi:uncharacterized protein KGF55_004832 [Candida pseudojiufengensis]|uniref:uncharacterized protein n=1 Tax=Candida pseudojiufengensis TaxID=497109 RepID=UPI0022248BD4|nr:uncharacterized protein KGF55_004832 [Candida pseudojiufengensis]KAI5960109.1 hypothetical protein KGF55_004832 [Candida pseudojiufengensis]